LAEGGNHGGLVDAACGATGELNIGHRKVLAMSGFDIFAWIVLVILVASVVAVFCIAGWLPGHIAKIPWPSLGGCCDGRRLGHPDLRLRTLAGRTDLGLCRRARAAQQGATAMMIALMAVYLVLLFAIVRLGIVHFKPVLEIIAFYRLAALEPRPLLFRWDGAPRRDRFLVVRNSVAIVPSVAGEVTEVADHRQHATEIRRRAVQDRPDALRRPGQGD